jgi:hypothetical protein
MMKNSPFAQPDECLSVSKLPGVPQMDSPIAEPVLKIDAHLREQSPSATSQIGRGFLRISCRLLMEKHQLDPVQDNTAKCLHTAVCIAQHTSNESYRTRWARQKEARTPGSPRFFHHN